MSILIYRFASVGFVMVDFSRRGQVPAIEPAVETFGPALWLDAVKPTGFHDHVNARPFAPPG